MSNNFIQQLLFQPVKGDIIIDDHSLTHYLRSVTGIGQFTSKVQFKVIIPFNLTISDFDKLLPSFNNVVLLKDRVHHWIDFLIDSFKQDWLTKLNTHLKLFHIIRLVKCQNLQFIVSFFLFNPEHSLHLRVDTQRPSISTCG